MDSAWRARHTVPSAAVLKEGVMWRAVLAVGLGVALAGTVVAQSVFAQHPAHRHGPPGSAPIMPGHDTFGAIAEIVRILEADPATDWSTVDIERLRQHLIDMNEVMLRSAVTQAPVPGGLAMDITGAGRTEQAIRAMVVPHAAELDRMGAWSARTEIIAGGVRLIVVAKRPDDATLVARI